MKAVSAVVVAAAVAAALMAGGARAEDNRDKLIPEYMAAAMDCVKDYEMDFTVCQEMMKDGVDLSQAKYEPCKCVPACVSKKRNLMSEAGEYDLDQFSKSVQEFGYDPWTEEWKRVLPICKDSFKGKKNCEAAASFAICGWKNSKMMRDNVGQYLGQTDA